MQLSKLAIVLNLNYISNRELLRLYANQRDEKLLKNNSYFLHFHILPWFLESCSYSALSATFQSSFISTHCPLLLALKFTGAGILCLY